MKEIDVCAMRDIIRSMSSECPTACRLGYLRAGQGVVQGVALRSTVVLSHQDLAERGDVMRDLTESTGLGLFMLVLKRVGMEMDSGCIDHHF